MVHALSPHTAGIDYPLDEVLHLQKKKGEILPDFRSTKISTLIVNCSVVRWENRRSEFWVFIAGGKKKPTKHKQNTLSLI